MHSIVKIITAACLLGLHIADTRPTIYMVNENDRLEPALVPVSSTVIPMAVYKVGASLTFSTKTSEPGKLITAHISLTPSFTYHFKGGKKKFQQDGNIAINIKQISKEEYQLQP